MLKYYSAGIIFVTKYRDSFQRGDDSQAVAAAAQRFAVSLTKFKLWGLVFLLVAICIEFGVIITLVHTRRRAEKRLM